MIGNYVKGFNYKDVEHAARVMYADTVFTANTDRAYNVVQKYLLRKVQEGKITMMDKCYIMHDILLYWNEADLLDAGGRVLRG